jgi:hypothetical protein
MYSHERFRHVALKVAYTIKKKCLLMMIINVLCDVSIYIVLKLPLYDIFPQLNNHSKTKILTAFILVHQFNKYISLRILFNVMRDLIHR